MLQFCRLCIGMECRLGDPIVSPHFSALDNSNVEGCYRVEFVACNLGLSGIGSRMCWRLQFCRLL